MTRPLLTFFSLTYAVTWICWAAAGAMSRGTVPANPALAALVGAVCLLGTIAPALVALALTERAGGRAATRVLLGQVFDWRVRAGWYVFAIGFFPAIKLSVALVHRVATGAWPRFGPEAWSPWRASGSPLLSSSLKCAGPQRCRAETLRGR